MFKNNVNQLTQNELIKIYIDEFNTSTERNLMIKGEKYYKVENDILNRKMYRYENEQQVEDDTKPNNKLAHGFMYTLIEDKINYLLRKPYTLSCDEENYLKKVTDTLGKRFQKRLSQLGTQASNKGIAWLHPYINSNGEFKTMLVPSEQVIPLWIDNDKEDLQAVIRYYTVEVYEGRTKKIITKIDYYTEEGVIYYVMDAEKVILDAERYLNHNGNSNVIPHYEVNGVGMSWGIVPFIPFKNNDMMIPDLQFVKTLVDNYDKTRSDVGNLLEDLKNIIYALRGYGGENLSEFVRELSYYGAIKIDSDDNSGIDKIEKTINIEAAKTHYEALKKDIFDFGQGVEKNSEKLGNSPSGIALKFIYSGLDLKCNALEDHFKWGFERLIYFANEFLHISNESVSNKEIEIVFNRDIAINESQAITDCMNSMGIISDQTIIENHPWTKDYEEEKKRLDEQNKEDDVNKILNDDGNE